MKKSQLRKIIRESIKQLMTEQSTPCSPAQIDAAFNPALLPWAPLSQQCHTWLPCGSNQNQPFVAMHPYSGPPWNAFGIVGPMGPNEIYVNMGSPQVGQVVKLGNIPAHHWKYLGIQNNQNYVGFNNWFHNKSPRGPQHIFPDCSTAINAVYGCTDPNAFNHDPNATQDDGSCDYGWRCGQLPSGGAVAEQVSMPTGCMPGTSTDIGVFSNEGQCLSQNTNIPNGCGGTNTGMKKADPTIDRMQKLANIEPDQSDQSKTAFPVDRPCKLDPNSPLGLGGLGMLPDCSKSTCLSKGGCPPGCKC